MPPEPSLTTARDAGDGALIDDAIPGDPVVDAGTDLRASVGWLALGIAVLIGSVTMDRLERQGINPYTIPGLLPGLLGIVMILLGVLLGLRSWQRGGLHLPRRAPERGFVLRLGLVLGLIVTYAVLLVGHGLPFWLASALFVAASIIVLQAPQRAEANRGMGLRDIAVAVAIGLGTGGIVHYVFQELFLVRLP